MTKFEKNTRNRFRKPERLTRKKDIQQLFSAGRSFHLHPFTVKYLPLTGPAPLTHQVLISVPKRNFKRAVDRNRLKRQIREAYRLHKHRLTGLPDKYAIAYIYSFKQKLPYKELENKLIASLDRLKNELAKKNNAS